MLRPRVLAVSFAPACALAAVLYFEFRGVAPAQGGAGAAETPGPGPVPADDFRERAGDGEPVRGGRVVVHLEARPTGLNTMLVSSAPVRRLLEELHARLVERNWETWELEPSLAESFDVEDVLVLAGGWRDPPPDEDEEDGRADDERGDGAAVVAAGVRPASEGGEQNILFGRVHAEGEVLVVEPVSRANPLAEAVRVPAEKVERVERGSVFTFHLRQDALWHDGHPFDARDVVFSLETCLNPWVQAEHARFRFERVRSFEALDAHTVRVFFGTTYFLALSAFEDEFTILPSHVFDLADPDNGDFDPRASPRRQGEYVNTHPRNARWLGLGPYRIVALDDQAIDAERFDGWFDPANGGFVDAIRWRIIADDAAARGALLAGELDFFARLRSREYLGEFCAEPAFAEHFDKGLTYTPQMSYVAWNLRRPLFEDVRVRRALAHAFDWDGFIATLGSGLGRRVTASWYCFAPEYDEGIEPIPFDLERARELLLEAGWYDRDGDGRIDREGKPFAFEFLYANVDTVSQYVGTALKENLAQLGIGMELVAVDFATRQERVGEHAFDAAALAWILGPESDPFGQWHSSQAEVQGSNNHPGFADPHADRLLEAIQTELDPAARRELFHALQRRVYDAQPYLFGCVFPSKWAVSKRVRGVQRFLLDPGYSIRRWYVEPAAEGR